MVKTARDLTGMKYGLLTVLRQGEDFLSGGRPIAGWLVSCECSPDKVFNVRQKDLISGHTKSCGCLKSTKTIERNKQMIGKEREKRGNTYDLSGEYGIGFTAKGEEFLFDKEDYPLIKKYTWYIDGYGYVVTNIKKNPTRMHRLILGITDKKIMIDHVYHNKNDNRKSQLRVCSNAENSRNMTVSRNNQSGVTGVYFDNDRGKWHAQIRVDRKEIFLGRYDNFDDAVKARKEAEIKYFKEFAPKYLEESRKDGGVNED